MCAWEHAPFVASTCVRQCVGLHTWLRHHYRSGAGVEACWSTIGAEQLGRELGSNNCLGATRMALTNVNSSKRDAISRRSRRCP